MALNDNATLVINAGNYFRAPVGTAFPTNPLVPGTPWVNLGHSSAEDILGIASEGGDRTVIGTLQNKSLRTVTSPRTETFTLNLQQWDDETVRLYFGSNAVDLDTEGEGLIGVPSAPAPTEAAFLAVYTDGNRHFAIYAPKASYLRGDDIDFADTESLASLPVAVTPLQHLTNTWPYAVKPPVTSA